VLRDRKALTAKSSDRKESRDDAHAAVPA